MCPTPLFLRKVFKTDYLRLDFESEWSLEMLWLKIFLAHRSNPIASLVKSALLLNPSLYYKTFVEFQFPGNREDAVLNLRLEVFREARHFRQNSEILLAQL